MKRLNKKGQTEDFVADLIPSMIIIAIGLYILGTMQGDDIKSAEEIKERLLERFEERKTINDYLSKEIGIDNRKITLNELISLSYQNEKYQEKVKDELKWIINQGVLKNGRKFTMENCEVVTCLNAEVQYPDGSVINLDKDIFCPGEEKTIFFPTYEGQSIKMTFQFGAALGQC